MQHPHELFEPDQRSAGVGSAMLEGGSIATMRLAPKPWHRNSVDTFICKLLITNTTPGRNTTAGWFIASRNLAAIPDPAASA
jgi:hypothetical protein